MNTQLKPESKPELKTEVCEQCRMELVNMRVFLLDEIRRAKQLEVLLQNVESTLELAERLRL